MTGVGMSIIKPILESFLQLNLYKLSLRRARRCGLNQRDWDMNL